MGEACPGGGGVVGGAGNAGNKRAAPIPCLPRCSASGAGRDAAAARESPVPTAPRPARDRGVYGPTKEGTETAVQSPHLC